MTKEFWVQLGLSLGVLVATAAGLYLLALAKAREAAVGAIADAEEENKPGKEKMQLAVETVYAALPPVIRTVLPKSCLETIIQSAFDKMVAYAARKYGGAR